MASLRVTNGPSTGRQIQVEPELFVGREGVDLVVDDPEMSRRHAAVRLLDGVIEVEDLGSSNGTFVNGERIEAPTLVNGGGQIRCGTTVFEVLGVVPGRTRISRPADSAAGAETIADPQATRARAIVEPQATKARPIADPEATAPRSIVRPQSSPPAAPARAAAAPGTTGLPAAAVGVFSPPVQRRSRGLASRSWVPVVLSFGTVVVVAVALVIYFAAR